MWKEKIMVKTAIWFMVLTIASLFATATICAADGGLLQVTVQKAPQNQLSGMRSADLHGFCHETCSRAG